ncbi:MAG TPA: hypothetical protein QF804_08000, partial [Rhodospirillales bacterium]|nr:hypothetical protein [Rhodospirillales bacterium]
MRAGAALEAEHVGADAAPKLVDALAAEKGVVAGIAQQRVSAAAARQRVVAASSVEGVGARVPGQRIGDPRAGHVVEGEQGVGADSGTGGASGRGPVDTAERDAHARGVVAVGKRVDEGAGASGVTDSRVAAKGVGIGAGFGSQDHVVAVTADDRIDAVSTFEA